jgi:predicted permease
VLSVFLEVILPVALVAAAGGVIGRKLSFDLDTFSKAVFWLFSPCLVFNGISQVDQAGGEVLRVVAVAASVFAANIVLAQVVSRVRGDDERAVASATLASGLANQGNLGLPLSRLAFGAAGLELGTLVWVTNLVLGNSVGIAAASLGRSTSGRSPLRSAAVAPFRFPAIYAAAAGIVVNVANLDLPVAIHESVASLAGAAIPCMLIVLGLQFHLPSRGDLVDPVLVSANRLVVGPLVAWGAAAGLGLAGVGLRESIMMAGMPTAVMVTIMAAQLDARPAAAVRTVVVSTLGSLATLTVLISILR